MRKQAILLILSSIMYNLAFLYTQYAWWFIFLFPLPLFYLTSFQTISTSSAYMWGLFLFFLHSIDGIYLISCITYPCWWVGFGISIFTVFYHALYSVFLCKALDTCFSFFLIQSYIIRLLCTAVLLCIFFTFIDSYSWFIFGVCEGYPLMHPLIPLAYKPNILQLLPTIGKFLLLFFIFLIPLSYVAVGMYKNGGVLLLCISIHFFWLYCYYYEPIKHATTHWYKDIKTIPYMFYTTKNNSSVMSILLSQKIHIILDEYPETELIIMPESSCCIENITTISNLLHKKKEPQKPIHLIFGATYVKNDHYYNGLHWICDNHVLHSYDKTHAMLITERLPYWIDNALLRALFFKHYCPIAVSRSDKSLITINDEIKLLPFICSEFFFSQDLIKDEYTLLVIINDSLFLWCRYIGYINRLLLLLAQLKSIEWQREILYVSYAHSVYIAPSGEYIPLNE